MDATTIATWVGIAVTAGGAVAAAIRFAFWAFDEWHKRRSHKGFSAPTGTLRIALKPEGHCWWSMGKRGDEPIMQIVGRAFATNVAAVPVRIPQVELRHGLLITWFNAVITDKSCLPRTRIFSSTSRISRS